MLKFLANYLLFGLVEIKNYLYEKNIFKTVKSNFPIISVGNISFGGTGKTPFVIYLAKKLINLNFTPLILSRGYKRKTKELLIISKESPGADVKNLGDESYLLWTKVKAPIVLSKVKYKAIEIIEQNFDIDVIIVDDGFQHRKLSRDLDIVLVDQKTSKIFLREPLKNIERANIILLEEGTNLNCLPSVDLDIFYYKKRIESFYNLDSEIVAHEKFVGERIALLSGLGNNEGFRISLESYSPKICKHFIFPDHHYYSLKDVNKIIYQSQQLQVSTIITTEKDFVKLIEFRNVFLERGIKLITSVLEFDIKNEDNLLQKILSVIKKG